MCTFCEFFICIYLVSKFEYQIYLKLLNPVEPLNNAKNKSF